MDRMYNMSQLRMEGKRYGRNGIAVDPNTAAGVRF